MAQLDSYVKTIAAGALAMADDKADPAVVAAYAVLKQTLDDRYAIDLHALEKKPDSSGRQAVLTEDLTDVNAGSDAELVGQIVALAEALAANPAGRAAAEIIAIDLQSVRGQSLSIHDVASDQIGVRGRDLDIAGDITIANVNVGTDRAQSQPSPQPEAPPSAPITILFLAANPSDQTRLNLEEESRRIDRQLRLSDHRDRFDLEKQFAVRAGDIQELLLRHRPQIVHFSGHGSAANELIFQDDQGVSHPVSTGALADLFRLLGSDIRCVVLNACYAEGQARAMAEHVPCVIGMADAVGDDAAIAFAGAFYRALGYGSDVLQAFELAINEIGLANLGEEHIPVLIALDDPAKVRLIE